MAADGRLGDGQLTGGTGQGWTGGLVEDRTGRGWLGGLQNTFEWLLGCRAEPDEVQPLARMGWTRRVA